MNSKLKKQYRIPILCISTMFFWASLYAYIPILSPYLSSIGASHKISGLIIGAYGLFQLILRIPIGILSDRFHKRRVFILFGMFFSLLSAIGFLCSQNLRFLLIFRTLAGAAAATWVEFTVLFSSYYKPEESTKAMGIMNFSCLFGETVAMFIGGLAADGYGWSAPFKISIVLGIIGVVLCFFISENAESSSRKISRTDFLKVASDKFLIKVSFLAVLCQLLIFATVFGFVPLYADSILHSNKFEISMLTVFSTLPIALASLMVGFGFVMRLGEKKLIVSGFLLAGVFTILVPFSETLSVLIATQIMAGIGKGLTLSSLTGLSIKNMEVEKRGTAMGFFQAVYGLGIFVGPLVMGTIGDHSSLQQGFIFIGILGVAAAAVSHIIICVKEERK